MCGAVCVTTGPAETCCCTSSLYQKQMTPSPAFCLAWERAVPGRRPVGCNWTPSTEIKMPGNSSIHRAKKQRFAGFPTISQAAISGWTERISYTWCKSDSFLDNVVINTALIPGAGIFVILASTYTGNGQSSVGFSGKLKTWVTSELNWDFVKILFLRSSKSRKSISLSGD